jgi:hypothetical protein
VVGEFGRRALGAEDQDVEEARLEFQDGVDRIRGDRGAVPLGEEQRLDEMADALGRVEDEHVHRVPPLSWYPASRGREGSDTCIGERSRNP